MDRTQIHAFNEPCSERSLLRSISCAFWIWRKRSGNNVHRTCGKGQLSAVLFPGNAVSKGVLPSRRHRVSPGAPLASRIAAERPPGIHRLQGIRRKAAQALALLVSWWLRSAYLKACW